MNRSIKTPHRAAAGFTLLEVVFGMMIAGIVLTGVYQTAVACLRLSQTVTDRQQGEMHLHALLGVLRRNIEDIPGNAKISMEPPEGFGGALASEIVLEDFPLAFTWAGVAAGSKRVLLITDKDPRGGTRIRIQYLSEEEAEEHADGRQVSEDDALGMTLMDGLKSVYWRFYNQRTEEWEEDWVRPNERPSLVEMNIEFYDDSDPLRSVFWIPVVVNPETVARGQGQSGARRSAPTGGGVAPPPGGGGAPRPPTRTPVPVPRTPGS
jgi:prepilin-type N-terminal cleavage/methylation domain-containing protein